MKTECMQKKCKAYLILAVSRNLRSCFHCMAFNDNARMKQLNKNGFGWNNERQGIISSLKAHFHLGLDCCV